MFEPGTVVNCIMSLLSILLYCGAGTALGITAHLALFIHGEWHVRAPEIFIFHCVLFTSTLTANTLSSGTEYYSFFEGILYMSYCYVSVLLTSIMVYRLWFHRLTRDEFPGPWYLRVSKLCHVWAVRRSKNYVVLDDLHRKYGDFVRTGKPGTRPRSSKEKQKVTYLPVKAQLKSPCSIPKSSRQLTAHGQSALSRSGMISYTLSSPLCLQETSPYTPLGVVNGFAALHQKVCSSKFQKLDGERMNSRDRFDVTPSSALTQHENKILKHIDELDRRIENDVLLHKPSEMRDLCFWFGFDAMGDFVFNKSFNMLFDQKWHCVVTRLQRALSLLGPLSPAPWLVQLGLRLGPKVWVLRDWHESVAWAKGEMRTRLDRGWAKQGGDPDLTHYLMEQENEISFKDSLYWMHGDSLLAIVAGRLVKPTQNMRGICKQLTLAIPKRANSICASRHLLRAGKTSV